MFKNLIIYRIAPLWAATLEQVEEALAKAPFIECGATQEKSLGWVPPRGQAEGALVESVGGQWILRFMIESKAIPASVLARKVKEKADRIEQETGRKPGRKESKELKEEAKLDMLPMAFSKQASTWVWINPVNRLLVIDASSQGRADEIVTLLVESLSGLSLSLLLTQSSPQACMAHWLKEQEPPVGFTVDRECELKSAGEEKAVVRYEHHALDIEEIRAHIDAGKLPTHLALTWDDRVSFLLTDDLEIKKVEFLDTVFEGSKAEDDGFDTDVAILTGELTKMIPDLAEALGGEAEPGLRLGGQLHIEIGDTAKNAPPGVMQAVRNMDNLARENGHKVTLSVAGGQQVASFGDGPDPMYQKALEIVTGDGKASISYLQRKLRIGYNRAARLLEAMEKQGAVSAMDSDGARTVNLPF